MLNWIRSLKEKIDIFFHKLSKRFNERDVLIFLLVILLLLRQVCGPNNE